MNLFHILKAKMIYFPTFNTCKFESSITPPTVCPLEQNRKPVMLLLILVSPTKIIKNQADNFGDIARRTSVCYVVL